MQIARALDPAVHETRDRRRQSRSRGRCSRFRRQCGPGLVLGGLRDPETVVRSWKLGLEARRSRIAQTF